jgi:diguanylate cyclase (GGDEF)-like protein
VPCKLRLLIVENDPALRRVLENTMGEAGHTVFTASDGKEGLELALGLRPQLIITEWAMPEMDGISFCKVLRQTKAGRRVYVLILSDSDDDRKLIEAFEAGADDYIVKPFDPMVLGARLRAGQRVIQLQDEIELDRQDIRRIATELAVSNRRLQQVALTDPLTGVPNRRFAMERLDQEWAAANRSGHPLSCLVIDVDHFKQVNDTYGHDIGDEVLKLTAETLKRFSRVQDTVSRVGGEEFLVICPDTDATAAHQCADRLRKAVAAAPMDAGGFTIQVTISIGVATRDKTMADPDALTKRADRAVYQAKRAGRNRTVAGKASGTE